MTNTAPALEELCRLRSSVFSRAKLWWGYGVAFGYLAIAAFPIAWLIESKQWIGPLAAVLSAIAGRLCVWRSDGLRDDAEWILRASELNRGIGYRADAIKVASLKSKYFRLVQKRDDSTDEEVYYEASGTPSWSIFIEMERESAWWTDQLAAKASKTIFVTMCMVAVASMSVIALGGLEVEGNADTTTSSEVVRRAYGLAICGIVLLDILSLGVRYRMLSVAARESMRTFTELLDEIQSACVPKLMTAVSEYQSARRAGPLLPDWFKRWHERSLQSIWDEALSPKDKPGS